MRAGHDGAISDAEGAETRATLIAVPDDSTSRVLHAAFYPRETTEAVMHALRDVFRTQGPAHGDLPYRAVDYSDTLLAT